MTNAAQLSRRGVIVGVTQTLLRPCRLGATTTGSNQAAQAKQRDSAGGGNDGAADVIEVGKAASILEVVGADDELLDSSGGDGAGLAGVEQRAVQVVVDRAQATVGEGGSAATASWNH